MTFLAEIKLFAGDFAPEGWLPCDGRELDVQRHQALFSIIGNVYGGDGIKTFRIPDLRGAVAVGVNKGLARRPVHGIGKEFGSEKVTVKGAVPLPAHNHDLQCQWPTPTVTPGTPGTPVDVTIGVNTGQATNGVSADKGILATQGRPLTGGTNPFIFTNSVSPGAKLGGVVVTGGTHPGTPSVSLSGGSVAMSKAGIENASFSAEVNVCQPSLSLTYIICTDGGDYPPHPSD